MFKSLACVRILGSIVHGVKRARPGYYYDSHRPPPNRKLSTNTQKK